jgi:hypothetical protein
MEVNEIDQNQRYWISKIIWTLFVKWSIFTQGVIGDNSYN